MKLASSYTKGTPILQNWRKRNTTHGKKLTKHTQNNRCAREVQRQQSLEFPGTSKMIS